MQSIDSVHRPFSLASAFGIGVLILLTGLAEVYNSNRNIGLKPGREADQLIVADVDGPVARAGLIKGDTIVSIAGRRVLTEPEYEHATRFFRRGQPVKFEVRRNRKPLALNVIPGMPFSWDYLLLHVIEAAAFLLIALAAQRRGSGYLRTNLLSGFCIAVAVEMAMPEALRGYSDQEVFLKAFFYVLSGVQCGLALHLASVFPERRTWLIRHPRIIAGYYIGSIGFCLVVASTLVVDYFTDRQLFWTAGQADDIFTSWFLLAWAIALALLFGSSALSYPRKDVRQEASWLLAGVIPWLGLNIYSVVFRDELPAITEFLLLLLYPLSIAAVLRREFSLADNVLLELSPALSNAESMDQAIRIVLDKVESVVHPAYTFAWCRDGSPSGQWLGLPNSPGQSLQALLGTELFRQIESRREVLYAEALAQLYPRDVEESLVPFGVTLLVPIRGSRRSLTGLLMLSNKKSEDEYTLRDRKLLQAISAHAAICLESILHQIPGEASVDFREDARALDPAAAPHKLFISYSRKDQRETDWLNRVEIHFEPLKRRHKIEIWNDRRIKSGLWRKAIEGALRTSDAAVLLVGPGFLASKFIAEVELPLLLEAARNRNMKVFPVMLSPCSYDKSELADYQAINLNKPLATLTIPEQDEILVKLVDTVAGSL